MQIAGCVLVPGLSSRFLTPLKVREESHVFKDKPDKVCFLRCGVYVCTPKATSPVSIVTWQQTCVRSPLQISKPSQIVLLENIRCRVCVCITRPPQERYDNQSDPIRHSTRVLDPDWTGPGATEAPGSSQLWLPHLLGVSCPEGSPPTTMTTSPGPSHMVVFNAGWSGVAGMDGDACS